LPKGSYRISGYRIDQEKLETLLGPLESKVMKTIWSMPKEKMTVREIYGKMSEHEKVAYTTVMSTMDTLHRKGLLERKIAKGRGGLFYVYWANLGQESFERSAVHQVLDSLTRNFGDTVTSYLIEKWAVDKEKLREVTKSLDAKQRKALKEEGR
jgi:predicted transcriptional regulator